MSPIPALYQQHYIAKQDERLNLFVLLAEHYGIQSALYPGAFVHITPSFVFPTTIYVESDRRAPAFYQSKAVLAYIRQRKRYRQRAVLRFYHTDYTQPIPEPEHSLDLLISQYAGFVSQHGKRYLKPGGWLLANNSHADADLAFLDPDFTLVGAVARRADRFSLAETDLETYFVPKKTGPRRTPAAVAQSGRGQGYTRSPFSYIFRYCQFSPTTPIPPV